MQVDGNSGSGSQGGGGEPEPPSLADVIAAQRQKLAELEAQKALADAAKEAAEQAALSPAERKMRELETQVAALTKRLAEQPDKGVSAGGASGSAPVVSSSPQFASMSARAPPVPPPWTGSKDKDSKLPSYLGVKSGSPWWWPTAIWCGGMSLQLSATFYRGQQSSGSGLSHRHSRQ